MAAADALAVQLAAVWPALAVLIVLGIVVAIIGGLVEWRRKWPHGYGRTCNRPLCPCWPSQVARLRREGSRS
ncbi:hypothetical protein [Microcella frigidaquae]|uniref:Uncharacterized protein n=1 Tax=Microcella frigidaquae TaxID=424758 RepID=A0A840X415_9MICO|nr:hypothetical protein [Microcella frigidaquae]MBB5617243.1 hypothetical protein [Microcella frigidaquae]NHN45057.1 hypothetical protein [Microcella frigidaquae]